MRAFLIAATLAAGAASADPCTTGLWTADLDHMARTMAGMTGGEVRALGGDVRMTIADGGAFTITAADWQIEMAIPGIPPVTVAVDGASSGTLGFDGGRYTADTDTIDVTGRGEVMGQTMEVPVTSPTGLFAGAAGTYDCDGDTLTIRADGAEGMVQVWTRAE